MKADAEIEAEEREKAEREVQRLGARGGGFTPLVGMTRRKLAQEKEGPVMMVFAIGMLALLVIVLLAWFLGPVLGAGVFWLVLAVAVVALLAGIFVRLGKR